MLSSRPDLPTVPDLTHATPPEIDTVLAELHGLRQGPASAAQTYRRRLRTNPGYADRLAEVEAEVERIDVAIRALAAEFSRRGGWTRAFLVSGNNGHVHRTMRCSTCRDTTEFHWLPAESGKDEELIVEKAGEKACSVCYPSAPVEVRNKPCQYEVPEVAAKRAARAAAAELKQTKAAAAAIAHPDGQPLLDEYGHVVEIERMAQIAYVRTAAEARAYAGPWAGLGAQADKLFEEYSTLSTRLLEALAHKRRPDDESRVDAEREALGPKVAKKFRDLTKDS